MRRFDFHHSFFGVSARFCMSAPFVGFPVSTRRDRLQAAPASSRLASFGTASWLPRSWWLAALVSCSCGRFGYEQLDRELDASVTDESDASVVSSGGGTPSHLTSSFDSETVTDSVFHSSSSTASRADSSSIPTSASESFDPGETSMTPDPTSPSDTGTDGPVTSPADSSLSTDPATTSDAAPATTSDTTSDATSDTISDTTSNAISEPTSDVTSDAPSSTTSEVTSSTPQDSTSDETSTGQCADEQNQCGGDCAPCACYWDSLELLGPPNYVGNGLYSPTLSADGLTLWFGLILSGGLEQLAYATRPSQNNAFGSGTLASGPLRSNTWEGNPHLSANQLALYFYSARNNDDLGLFRATRGSSGGTFDQVVELTTVNSTATEQLPWVTADERTLYFVSDRAGSRDIWKATRAQTTDAFSSPTPVAELNTSGDEGKISLTSDGLVAIFAAQRSGGLGGLDLYRAARRSTQVPFETPTLITGLSSPFDDYDPELTRDGNLLYFVSTRTGDSAVWRARMRCD